MSHSNRSLVLLVALCAALVLLSCGDGGSSGDATVPLQRGGPISSPTPGSAATIEQPTSSTSTSPFATAFSGPNEGGSAPVFYRTADNFASLVAGQPYKVLFRITNGYAELTLTVTGVCTNCRTPNEPPTATLSGIMVQPVGEDAPGSYYPTNLLLPRAGHWELTVQATPDDVTIPIDVQPAP